jgi:deazaflavin-dependent oxidoreductase (nitroreductase family)
LTKQSRWWQRLVKKVGATDGGAWLFSHTIHRIDTPILRLTQGRYSLTELLSGLPVATLTAIGAKSGQPRVVPLVALSNGDEMVLIASSFGRSRHPAWYYNLRANPGVTLTFDGQTRSYIAREAEGAERERYWQLAIERYIGFAGYQERAGNRRIPVIILTPV